MKHIITDRARGATIGYDKQVGENTRDYRLFVDNDHLAYGLMEQLITDCANRKHKDPYKSITEFWKRQRSFVPSPYNWLFPINQANLYLNWLDRFVGSPSLDTLTGIATFRAKHTPLFYENPGVILAAVPKTAEDLRFFIDGESLAVYEHFDLPLYAPGKGSWANLLKLA